MSRKRDASEISSSSSSSEEVIMREWVSLKLTTAQVLTKDFRFEHVPMVERLLSAFDFGRAQALASVEPDLVIEFVRYMILRAINEDYDKKMFRPSTAVDKVWHALLQLPVEYISFCNLLSGKSGLIYDHDPFVLANPKNGKDAKLEATKAEYNRVFGEAAPARFWSDSDALPVVSAKKNETKQYNAKEADKEEEEQVEMPAKKPTSRQTAMREEAAKQEKAKQEAADKEAAKHEAAKKKAATSSAPKAKPGERYPGEFEHDRMLGYAPGGRRGGFSGCC